MSDILSNFLGNSRSSSVRIACRTSFSSSGSSRMASNTNRGFCLYYSDDVGFIYRWSFQYFLILIVRIRGHQFSRIVLWRGRSEQRALGRNPWPARIARGSGANLVYNHQYLAVSARAHHIAYLPAHCLDSLCERRLSHRRRRQSCEARPRRPPRKTAA